MAVGIAIGDDVMYLQPIRAATFRASVAVAVKSQATNLLPFLVIGRGLTAAPEVTLLTTANIGVVLAAAIKRTTDFLLFEFGAKLGTADRACANLGMSVPPSSREVTLLRAIFRIVAFAARLLYVERSAAVRARSLLPGGGRQLPSTLLIPHSAAFRRAAYLSHGSRDAELLAAYDTGANLLSCAAPACGLIARVRAEPSIQRDARGRNIKCLAAVLAGAILSRFHTDSIPQFCNKPSYYRQAVKNLAHIEPEVETPDLFTAAGIEVPA